MKRTSPVLPIGVCLAISLLFGQRSDTVAAQAPGRQISADAVHTSDEVIIQFRAGTSDLDKREARGWVNAQRRELIRSGAGAAELERAGLAVGMPIEVAIDLLNRHPAVAFAEPNWIYTHEDTSDDPLFMDGTLWGMYGAGSNPSNQFGSQAATAWQGGRIGDRAVIVAVIDEGIDYAHEDLAPNIWINPYDPADGMDNDANGYVDDVRGWDFYQNNNSVFDGADSHGTHVAGTIGALGGNSKGVAGVNWNVTIISAKFLGPGGGTTASAIKAVDYVTNLKKLHPNLNIVATNNSWGGGGYSQALHDAIIRAAKGRILFVAAAGNSGLNNDSTASYPSNYNTATGTATESGAGYDSVIAVAAIDGVGLKASWSSYGSTTVDLGAPGVDIWSTTPYGYYGSKSGTSMAPPHVTGAAALYASMNAGVSAAAIKTALLNSAIYTPTASLAGITVTGGRLNIAAMLPASAAPLTITCPANQNATSPTGSSVAVSYSAPTTTGGAPPVSVSSNPQSGSAFPVGTTTVNATASSDDGQTATCSFTVTVTYTPVAAFSLTATGFKTKGLQHANLSWSSAPTASVKVYRDGTLRATVSGTAYTDNIGKKGGGTYRYLVCGTNVPATCSNISTVVF